MTAWTDQEISYLAEHWTHTSSTILCEQMSRKFGRRISRNAVVGMANRRGFKKGAYNAVKASTAPKVRGCELLDPAEIMRLTGRGYIDRDIASMLGCSRAMLCDARKFHKLPSNDNWRAKTRKASRPVRKATRLWNAPKVAKPVMLRTKVGGMYLHASGEKLTSYKSGAAVYRGTPQQAQAMAANWNGPELYQHREREA